MKKLTAIALAVSLLSSVSFAPLAAAHDGDLERVLIESATTPQQHAALAHYYEGKAAAARKEAEEHRAMGKAYGGAKATQVGAMKEHCDKLAASYEAQAKEFDAMASVHKGMAK